MNFEQLLYVEVLAQHNSMQKAAEVLHISKSGLSIAINQFERELGVRLFDKSPAGTQLTIEGGQLLSSISDILSFKNNLENTAAIVANPKKHQRISIHYMNTMLKPFMNTFIDNYASKFKNVQFDISCHEFESIVRRVHNQEIDAGFIAINNIQDAAVKGLVFTPVCDSKLVLLCAPDNFLNTLGRPITLEDLKKQQFSIFNDKFHDEIFEKLQFQCGPLSLILRVDDAWAMNKAIIKLNTVCFGRILQGDLSSNPNFSNLKTIDVGHIIDDNFKLGWLTNPNHMISKKTRELLQDITAEIKRECNINRKSLSTNYKLRT
ncbi:LysR family transcriptional regulator [Lactobacillus sp. UCMA15818]|uniref:LysR family transcriptional regulator n=1 Tax=Lactobacillus sp. UCMA15818 TaxID=2583394 RepID=UPI0025B1EF99|nr:LysR family transcriptional regulator [Lactobacillus sp. UCMA15818]MDN2453594.1 LysR family transcriptional regulator [Lactobacillus sp. UCMA15818]